MLLIWGSTQSIAQLTCQDVQGRCQNYAGSINSRPMLLEKENAMLTDYIQAAMHKAHYELIEDRTFVATIPGFQGIWANAETLEACRDELRSVLEDWILVSLTQQVPLPVLDGLDLNLDPNPSPVEVA